MKKGQAAMEFLMTYGWAILVVLLAIAALAYFGVLNPGNYLPSSCTMQGAGLSCVEFMADSDSNEVTLVLQNGKGENLNSINVSVGGDCSGYVEQDTESNTVFVDGTKATFVVPCAENLIAESRFQEDIMIDYLSENDLSRSIKGTLTTRVE